MSDIYGFEIRDSTSQNNIILNSDDTTMRIVASIRKKYSFVGKITRADDSALANFSIKRGSFYIRPIATFFDAFINSTSSPTIDPLDNLDLDIQTLNVKNYGNRSMGGPVQNPPRLSWNDSAKEMTVIKPLKIPCTKFVPSNFTTSTNYGGHFEVVFFEYG